MTDPLCMNISLLIGHDHNQSDVDEPPQDTLTFGGKFAFCFVICPMIVICICGNALTIVSYLQDQKLQTVQNVYLINLAVADFIVGLISMPVYLVTTLMDYYWIFGKPFCKIWNSVDFLVCIESAYAVVLISFDRSLMVWQGASYSVRQTKKCAAIRIAVTWCLSFVIYVPAVLLWDVWAGHSVVKDGVCELEFFKNAAYTLTTSLLECLIPFVSITILSLYLYISITKRTKLAVANRLWSSCSGNDRASFHTICSELDGNGTKTAVDTRETQDQKQIEMSTLKKKEPGYVEKRILMRNTRAARRLAVLVMAFVVCWTPYTITTIIIAVCDGCVSDHLYEALIWLQWTNSALNPFLYALTTPRFRENYARLLHLGNCGANKKKRNSDKHQPAKTSISSC